VVEGTGLENRQTRKRLEGSNPSPSAIRLRLRYGAGGPAEIQHRSVHRYFSGGRFCGSTMTA
jgi:hypothetical protein